ncbi:MAG: phosphodiester glycosidase family protein [Oscillospiraceae bacterium]|nr:phosphodiester glycosidase family protein [Oscillospiraceae bacterium]
MKRQHNRFRRLAALLSAGILLAAPAAMSYPAAADTTAPDAASEPDLSPEAVHAALMAMKSQYPEGMRFTNEDTYIFQHMEDGYPTYAGGCAAFAFILSDAAFGELPARYYYDLRNIRVGDILRVNEGGHSVIVTEVLDDGVIVAEGNYNSSVHWGRKLSNTEIFNGSTVYGITRYPAEHELLTGDIDDSGEVNARDAQMLLRACVDVLAGKPSPLTEAQEAAADVDWSGSVDARDAQYILQYAVHSLAGKPVTWEKLCPKQYDTSGFGAKWPDLFADPGKVEQTVSSYRSHDIYINIMHMYSPDNSSRITIADIYLRSADCFQYAFAQDGNPETYANGLVTGLQENMIDMCDRTDAVLAINGDFMGGRTNGVVIRDGYTWRSTPWNDVAALYRDGSVETFSKDEFDEAAAYEKGILHSFAFGPALVRNGELQSGWTASHLTAKEPRSGFGYYEPGHYCFITADGRGMGGSQGLTAEEFADLFHFIGCREAFNLDGGKTSQLVFCGYVINQPDGFNGSKSSLRGMSDIFYIGEKH